MHAYAWLFAIGLFLFSPAAFAQIEVQQNGDVELGTAGSTPNSTTVNGNLNVTGALTVDGVVPGTLVKYVQIPGPITTSSGNLDAMTGLSLVLPTSSATQTTALVTLNVPSPFASGTNFPGGSFVIEVNNAIPANQPFASFTSFEAAPASFGRVPTTLVVLVPLSPSGTTTVQAMWQSIRGSTVKIDSPASLSAVIGATGP
jgi:hypothetical protein